MEIVNSRERQFLKMRILCAVVAVAFAVGLWANLPYIVVEHQRLESWKIIGLWIGDFMGLVWFGRFVMVHVILEEPLMSTAVVDKRRRLKFLIAIGVAAMLVDFAFTLYLMRD